MRFELPHHSTDPVIDAYKPGVDMTLIRENLKLTPNERVQQLVEMQKLYEEFRTAGEKSFHPGASGDVQQERSLRGRG